jgi:hypothetical protein
MFSFVFSLTPPADNDSGGGNHDGIGTDDGHIVCALGPFFFLFHLNNSTFSFVFIN